jgi:hypothetical protein
MKTYQQKVIADIVRKVFKVSCTWYLHCMTLNIVHGMLYVHCIIEMMADILVTELVFSAAWLIVDKCALMGDKQNTEEVKVKVAT